MIRIPTARGLDILADAEDAELLSQFSWWASPLYGGRFYASARVRGTSKRVSMHRLLMEPPPGMVVHHINNNGLDNRRANLAVMTQRSNLLEHFRQRPHGVHLHKETGRWRAQTRVDGKQVSIGMFADKAEAYAAVEAFLSREPSN